MRVQMLPIIAITPIIAYGENHATTAVFASGTANLDVYTKDDTLNIESECSDIVIIFFKGFVLSSFFLFNDDSLSISCFNRSIVS